MTCKGVCSRYKAAKPPRPLTRYGEGQKRCTACNIFTDWKGLRCPCCVSVLRTKPKAATSRKLMMIKNELNRIWSSFCTFYSSHVRNPRRWLSLLQNCDILNSPFMWKAPCSHCISELISPCLSVRCPCMWRLSFPGCNGDTFLS